MTHMVPVLGMVQRRGKTILKAMDHVSGQYIKPILKEFITPNSKIITDAFGGYYGIGASFEKHVQLNHEKKQIKWGRYRLSAIEGFVSTIKRAVIGQYHMQSYMDEIAFKKNHSQNEIFNVLITNCLNMRCH